jgi:hypothetical protein
MLARKWIGTLAIASVGVGGCRDRESPPAPAAPRPVEAIKQALNASPKVSDFVVLAGHSAQLRSASSVSSRIQLSGGDVGARGTSAPYLSRL